MMRVMIPVCPKCDAALLILRFKEIEVDFCDRCRGLWLDAGEVEQLVAQTGATGQDVLRDALQQPARATLCRFLCPRCDGRLEEFTINELVLDRCPEGHGLWFDAGELRQLLARSGAHSTVAYLGELLGAMPTA